MTRPLHPVWCLAEVCSPEDPQHPIMHMSALRDVQAPAEVPATNLGPDLFNDWPAWPAPLRLRVQLVASAVPGSSPVVALEAVDANGEAWTAPLYPEQAEALGRLLIAVSHEAAR